MVGEAYSLGRLNKARKSHSVPFKSSCYGNIRTPMPGWGRITAGHQKIRDTIGIIEPDQLLVFKQVMTFSAPN
jgi:hypothetical protein